MSNTDGPAELRRLAGDFELTKSECWNESDTTSMWALSVAWGVERAQAAADREDCAKFAGQNELLIKATGTETFSAALQRISVCAADRAALAQARALLTELYDDSPCRFDHHGHCQEHNSMTDVCIMRRIAAALSDGAL